jgi:short-subunit dehydrogenase
MPSDQQRWITEVNLVAPIALTQGLLTRQLLAPSASLVFVSSLSSFVSYPGAAVYAASKEGLASYARSLRAAPVMRGRHVLTVYPGPTRTAMAERCSPDNSEPLRARRMPPERLAGSIARAVESRQPALIPGFSNRLLAQLGRWIPGVTEHAMRHAIFEKLPSGKR